MKKYLKKISIIFIVLSSLLFISGTQKNQNDYNWYKGNLHMHSYWSDGDIFPEITMEWYKDHNYNFVGLSDHNILAEGEKWKKIPETEIMQKTFESYIDKYNKNQIVYKRDEGRTNVKLKTIKEYIDLFEEKEKFMVLQSEEISDSYDGKPIHLNAINIQKLIVPQNGNSVIDVLQNTIDAVNKQKEETAKSILTIINHPNFGYAFSDKELSQLNNARFFEVYNSHPSVRNKGDSAHVSTERMWDLTNTIYAQNNKSLLFGLATDDAHNYIQFGKEFANPGRGWIMVKANELSPSSILNSMENGDFYASSGVSLRNIRFKNNKLTINIEPEPGIKYTTLFIGTKTNTMVPEVLKKTKGANPGFKLKKDILFVRAKIISTKLKENTIYETEYEAAWTQPVIYQSHQ